MFCYCCFYSENNLQEDLFDQILVGKLEFPSPYWDNITDSAKVLMFFPHLKHFWQAPVQPGGSRAASSPEPQLLCIFSWFSWTVPAESSGVSGCHGSAWARVAKCQLHSGNITWTQVTSWCILQQVQCSSCKINVSLNFSLQSLFKKEKLLLYGLVAVGISSCLLLEAFIRAFQEVQPLPAVLVWSLQFCLNL